MNNTVWRSSNNDTRRAEENILRAKEPIWTRALESQPPGQNTKYGGWKTLDRLSVGAASTQTNFVEWRKEESYQHECGTVQDEKHLLQCPMMENTREWIDLFSNPNDGVTKVINF